jgi:membrane protein AbrB duplication
MLALTAGGASGLVAISRELGGDDRVVTVVQYLRVGLVTATMPVVAAVGFGASAGGAAPGVRRRAVAGRRRVPDGLRAGRDRAGPAGAGARRRLLGPMTVAIALNLTGLSFGAQPPELIVEIAYAVIGWQAGARFTRESLRTAVGVLPLATALIAVVIMACAGLGLVLVHLTGATALEGYLATTPGGVYAVHATAISAGVDVTFVVSVQVLRVIVMLLVAPALARLAGPRRD